MNSARTIEHPTSGISLVDIYFVLFRRKWLILLCTLLGIGVAIGYYFTRQPKFQSTNKLMIKYVTDVRPTGSADSAQVTSISELNSSLLNSEMQILGSYDVFLRVATNVGPAKILAMYGGGNDAHLAAGIIESGVKVEPSRDSGVILITFMHPDQTVIQPVLAAIVDAYHEKTTEVHKSIGISDDILMEKKADLQSQITSIEDEIRIAKTNAGIVDVADADRAYSDEMASIRHQLFQARADLDALNAANVKAAVAAAAARSTNAAADQKIPEEVLSRYKALCIRVAVLEKNQADYILQGYKDQNKLVMENNEQMTNTLWLKTSLEGQYPGLLTIDYTPSTTPDAATPANGSPAIPVASQINALTARVATLQNQLGEIQVDANKMADAEAKISDLTLKKKNIETYLANIGTSLENKAISEALGPGALFNNMPTIQEMQPPFRDFKKFYKNIGTIAMGGFLLGLALAFLIEFYLDRSIKRPIEVQTRLKIPFFLSIPDLNQGVSRKALAAPQRKLLANGSGEAAAGGAVAVKTTPLEVMSWEVNRRFNSYYDALRDRLVVYFESINLTRKPKLVAVTSTHKGAGVSTIAAGLASSLSETGDGRVLLVDMNMENGAAQQFFQGKPMCKLDDALEDETRDGACVSENLYVVTEDAFTDKLPRALPKRFASLIPKLKASDYDYIIFDMPPVSPTSVTARLSGFMDTVMLVIESEKTDQQIVQQANALLAQSKANVTAVLNKTRSYIPARLHQDFLSGVD